NGFWLRHVNFHNDNYSSGGQLTEIESDGTNIFHKSNGVMADYDPGYWSSFILLNSMSGEEANSCFARNNTDLFATNVNNCTFSNSGVTHSSRGVELSVGALIDPSFRNIFTLQK